jgi:hypothetical protein
MLSVSTLVALPANFELRCKNRQAGNFKQAGDPEVGLALENDACGSRTPSAGHSIVQDAADETIQFR